jgi:YesN/AraC family two-component response regulator
LKIKNQHITQFKLTSNTKAGISIVNIQSKKDDQHDISTPHRDDYYLLLFAFKGYFHFKIDFEDKILTAPFVLKIEPNQIHQLIKSDNAVGWAVGIEEFILEQEFQSFLETKLTQPLSLNHKSDFLESIETILKLGSHLQLNTLDVYSKKSIFYLVNSLLCLLIKETASNSESLNTKEKRSYIIEQEFKILLKTNFRLWKSPSMYASALSITVSHLNDTIKELTNFPVSIHIQNASILEAKRLLYFSDNSIKEIGYEIGYDDAVYFGKLFKKITSLTPLQFRQQFRD